MGYKEILSLEQCFVNKNGCEYWASWLAHCLGVTRDTLSDPPVCLLNRFGTSSSLIVRLPGAVEVEE